MPKNPKHLKAGVDLSVWGGLSKIPLDRRHRLILTRGYEGIQLGIVDSIAQRRGAALNIDWGLLTITFKGRLHLWDGIPKTLGLDVSPHNGMLIPRDARGHSLLLPKGER